ncbi:MAG TPA: guanylate kinase [Chitinophagales bacterium]
MSAEPHIVDFGKKVVVITAPSGAGKSTIVRKLLSQYSYLGFSISCTTRPKRENEIDGRDYHFLSIEEFKKKIANNEFVEYEEVYADTFYGTLKSEVEKVWAQRKIVLFDIDVKGALNIKKIYGENALVIFIAPPSVEVLKHRLENRNTESAATLKKRLKRSEEEMSYASKFEKSVVNADFDIAYMNVKNVITNFLKKASVAHH